MEKKRILELAWLYAIELWQFAEKLYKMNPNEFTKARVDKALYELKEIERMLKDEEIK